MFNPLIRLLAGCTPPARDIARACMALVLTAGAAAASANASGENAAWQFQTSADKVNQGVVRDMIQKRQSGYYAPPTYTTNIGKQYNCNLQASARGNEGTNSTVAHSPSTSGATADAAGNDSSTQVRGSDGSLVDSTQANQGSVGSSVVGSTSTHITGSATQSLQSTQTNSGSQSAQVSGSSACAFDVLN